MAMNGNHEPFFSFTVASRGSPPSAGGNGATYDPSGSAYAAAGAPPGTAGSSSVSPDPMHPVSGHRRSIGADPFAFSVPPGNGDEQSPASSHEYASRPGTGLVKPRSSHGVPPAPPADHRLPAPWTANGPSSNMIGPHNTRPMTAPGAGWGGGSFNHGYDYSSASAGLFGDGHTAGFTRTAPPPAVPEDTVAPSSATAATSSWPPTQQQLQSPLGASGSNGVAGGYDLFRARNFSLPDLASTSIPHGMPPFAPGAAGSPSTPNYLRPSTHAGTSIPFGDARPASSYGLYPAQGYAGTSRPGTGVSIASTAVPYPQSGYGVYGHSGVPSVLSQSGMGASAFGALSGYGADDVYGSDKYSFVSLPGQPRKRARRRYDEIERLYECNYPGCTKGYGTLNHLNAHITMQKHGPKRLPQEFKEIRKEWRARKKAEAEARSNAAKNGLPRSSAVEARPSTATVLPPSLADSRGSTAHAPSTAMSGYGIAAPPPLGTNSYYARPLTGHSQPASTSTSNGLAYGGGYGPRVDSHHAAAANVVGSQYAGDFSYHRPASSAGPVANIGGWANSQAVDA